MTEKVDRRVLRTRQLLRDVLLELALDKPMDEITVKELTDKADLNRGTFYLHYQDMHDFYEQFKNDMLEGYYNIIKKLGHRLNQREPFVDPPQGYVRPFEYVLEHRRFFKTFMGPQGDNAFSLQLTEILKQQFNNAYRVQHQLNPSVEIPAKQQYLYAYLASAYVGTMQLWIERNFDLTSAEMAVLFSQISRLGSAHIDFSA